MSHRVPKYTYVWQIQYLRVYEEEEGAEAPEVDDFRWDPFEDEFEVGPKGPAAEVAPPGPPEKYLSKGSLASAGVLARVVRSLDDDLKHYSRQVNSEWTL